MTGIRLLILVILFLTALCVFPTQAEPSEPRRLYVDGVWGNDLTGTGTITNPYKTPMRGIDELHKNLPGSEVIIRGGIYDYCDDPGNIIRVNGIHGNENFWYIIRGADGETVRLRGYGQKFPEDFDPTTLPDFPTGAYNVVSAAQSNHVIIANIRAEGGAEQTLEVNSNENGPTHDVVFYNVHATRCRGRGAFIVGKETTDISFYHCVFGDMLNLGSSTHAVYLSGGHWNTESSFKGFRFIKCHFWGGQRWGLQANGKIEDVVVDGCLFEYFCMGGLQFIGVQHASITNNIIKDPMKQGISLYNYFDTSYYDPGDPESVAVWKETHWENAHINIENNTIYRPYKWTNVKNYFPEFHSSIVLSKSDLCHQLGQPDAHHITIRNNNVTDHWGNFIRSDGANLNGDGNYFEHNLLFPYSIDPAYQQVWINNDGEIGNLDYFEAHYPNRWNNNIIANPLYMGRSEQFIDASAGPLHWAEVLDHYLADGNDFHLQEGSPAINTAHPTFYPTLDFDDILRPVQMNADRGAYEKPIHIPTQGGDVSNN